MLTNYIYNLLLIFLSSYYNIISSFYNFSFNFNINIKETIHFSSEDKVVFNSTSYCKVETQIVDF